MLPNKPRGIPRVDDLRAGLWWLRATVHAEKFPNWLDLAGKQWTTKGSCPIRARETYYAAAISAQLGYDPVERIQRAGLTRGTSNHGDETSREALAPELVRQH